MVVVVLGGVGVDLGQRHRVAEERVPADKEVHPSIDCIFVLGDQLSVELGDRAVQLCSLPSQAGSSQELLSCPPEQ